MHLDARNLCALLLTGSLLSVPAAQAANYYIGNDAACTQNRLAQAVLVAALAGDANPRFFISKNKPTENAEIVFSYNNLSTVEVRGGFNSCQDAINGVAPSGKSSIHSNAVATSANRRVMRVGNLNSGPSPTVDLFDVIISGGRLSGSTSTPDTLGAGILVARGTLRLTRTTVENNLNAPDTSNARGGGIALLSSSSTLGLGVGNLVRANTAYEGGGIYCTTNATVLFEGADVRENEALRRGGGVSVRNGCTALLSSGSQAGRIRNNQLIGTALDASAGGAGIYVGPGGNAIIAGTSGVRFQITGNAGTYQGAGVFVSGSNARLDMNWVDVDNNTTTSREGGGISCTLAGTAEAAVTTRNTRVRNNGANLGGGVFARNGCRIDLGFGTQVTGNTAVNKGGGLMASAIDLGTNAFINLTGTSSAVVVSGNQAFQGGGVAARATGSGQARVVLENAVVTNNSATSHGGGLYARGAGAEIRMERTLPSNACHNSFYCSDLSFNAITGPDTLLGAGAAVRDNAKLTIEGTYIEANQGTAIRAIDTNFDSPSGFLRVQSSVLIPHQNNRLIRVTRSRAFVLFNTLGYGNINSRPIAITEGNSATRATTIFGNIFDGNLPPVDVPNINWVHVFNGCSSFRQAHVGDPFYSAHAAARRLNGQVALQPGTFHLTDPTSPVIDFCDGDAIAIVEPPTTDIAGLSRPFNTPRPNVHGPWDLGAHEIRTGPFFTLTAARAGEGSLLSNPAGINCPGSCDASYPENTSVTVTATAAPGWRFTDWDQGCDGTNPVCTVLMDQDRTLVARFRQEFNLNIFLVGSGSVNIQPWDITCASNCTEVFVDGTQLVLVADPAPGFSFAGWTGACSGLGACELTMSTNRSVAAEFVAGPGADNIFRDRFEP